MSDAAPHIADVDASDTNATTRTDVADAGGVQAGEPDATWTQQATAAAAAATEVTAATTEVTAVVNDDEAGKSAVTQHVDDDTTAIAAAAADEKSDEQHAVDAAAADAAGSTADKNDDDANNAANDDDDGLSLKELFGAFFRLELVASAPDEPLLADTRGVLRAMFGVHVSEADVHVLPREALHGGTGGAATSAAAAAATTMLLPTAIDEELRRELDRNHEVRQRDRVEQLFGRSGTDALARDTAVERYTLLHADAFAASPPLPTTLLSSRRRQRTATPSAHDADAAFAAAGPTCEELWLMDMPKIAPNRLVLHVDPQPFVPSRSAAPLASNARMLYTPANVLRWAHHAGQKLYLSNARVVRWSDGSVTLHVGSDVHELAGTRDKATLHLLGSDVQLRHRSSGAALPAVVATVTPDRHLVVEAHKAVSVEQAILREGQQRESAAARMTLPYATTSMPDIDWSRPQKSRNLYEEYVAREYERRSKEMARRARDGRPMTLAEQIALEQEMLQHLRNTSAEALRDEQQQQQQQQHRHAQQLHDSGDDQEGGGGGRRRGQRQPRSRLDRDLGLTVSGRTTLYDVTAATTTTTGDEDDSDAARAGLKRQRDEDANSSDSSSDGSGSSSDSSSEDDDEDEFASMMRAMQRKHDRDDAAERQRKVARYEDEQRQRFAPLMAALQSLATRLPHDSDAYGSVNGTLEFLRGGAFASGMVAKEVPLLLREVAAELPDTDTSDVAAALQAIVTATTTAAAAQQDT